MKNFFKRLQIKHIFLYVLLLTSVTNYSQNYESIMQDVDTLTGGNYPGPIFPMNDNVVPLISGNILSGDCGFSIYSVATTYGDGKVIAVGHEAILVNGVVEKYDNIKFLVNSMKWLNSDKKRILIKNGWIGESNMSIIITELKKEGYTVTSTSSTIENINLSCYDIIIFGNDWNNNNPYSKSEINIIEQYVKNGGSIFIAGLGWSVSNLEKYSMNSIANIFGFKYVYGVMWGTNYFTNLYTNIKDLNISGSVRNLNSICKKYGSNLPTILQNNTQVRDSFVKANIYLRYAVENLPINSELRDSIYKKYKDIITNNSIIFQKARIYNNINETSMIWNRERIYSNLIESKQLTDDIVSETVNILGLRNEYLEIWKKNKILLLDNSKLDKEQLLFIKNILSSIPSDLHNLRTISFSDFLGATNTIPLGSNVHGGVNTFSTKIGYYPQNQFPSEITAGVTSIFCSAISHEINHIVDAFYVNSSEKFRNRKQQLINRAGKIGKNYLRGDENTNGFFLENPQEFFASISNQWFTNSENVLKLALSRYNNQYKEPINQFLFYADIYSLCTDSTIFYKNDVNGNLISYKVPLKRDINNNINFIEIDNIKYDFQLDNNGNVINYVTYDNLTSTENNINIDVKIYPNPTSSFLNVFCSNYDCKITIINIQGQKIYESSMDDNKIIIDIKSILDKGTYIIQIRDNKNNILKNEKILVN